MEEEIRLIMAKDSWVETYEEICIAAALSNDFTVLAASSEENRQLNRYQDVYPYDHSRVLLKNVTKGTDYINASLVKNERACRRYILAQGPLQRTIGHFWSMVWHEKSSAILMLNRLIEKGVKKCEQYWPPNPGETILCPEVNLRVDSESSDQRTDYVLTSLYITDLKSGERRRILHFQYIMWPDFGVPRCPDSFLNFLEAVRKTGSLEEDVGPPVVHCSAGIGRSGTFCLVDTSLVLLAKDGPSSVILKDILLDLRNYRMGLIQTWEQLRFSYLAVVAGAKRDERISLKLFDDRALFASHPSKASEEDGPPPIPPPRTDSLIKNLTTPQSNGSTHSEHLVNGDVSEEKKDQLLGTKTDSSSSEKSTTILNNHKMEERKREVKEQRRRQMRDDRKQETLKLLEEIRRKQRESEKQKIKRSYAYENMLSFCVGVLMVVAGVTFYYYERS